jgi:hypothetical protein
MKKFYVGVAAGIGLGLFFLGLAREATELVKWTREPNHGIQAV